MATPFDAKPVPFEPEGRDEKWKRDVMLLLALLSFADIQQAPARWDTLVPRQYRGMLLAQRSDGERQRPAGWWYDATIIAYGVGSKVIDFNAVRTVTLDYLTQTGRQFQRLASAMADGTLPVDAWQRQMATFVKQNQAVLTTVGGGGVQGVDASDVKIGQEATQFQLERLLAFAGQIVDKDPAASSTASVLRRSGLYATSAITTFEAVRRNSASDAYDEERRILRPAEHCDTCIEQAEQGWQPIGTLNEIGDSECRAFCKCYFTYRKKK